jgi:Domain of unknown function (DUF1707)
MTGSSSHAPWKRCWDELADQDGARAASRPILSGQLPADHDRARAEGILRAGFAPARLSLEELTARVTTVHNAGTIGQLQTALRPAGGALTREHRVDPARSVLIGTGSAHRTLATTLGAHYLRV